MKRMSLLDSFIREQRGQDLIEYSLLLAFVCLASAFLFVNVGQSIIGIWSSTSTAAAEANAAATAAGT